MGGPLSSNAQAWESAIARELQSMHGSTLYTQIVCRQLTGMLLLVYARSDLAVACSLPRTVSVGTGLLGVLGNKGAVCTSLRIHSSTMCFVCAHLSAGANHCETRNAEAASLLLKTAFGVEEGGPDTVLEHEYVFFFGDLNYRIEMEGEEVRQAVKRHDLPTLRKHDQLLQSQVGGDRSPHRHSIPHPFARSRRRAPSARLSQAEGLCFPGFEEPTIEFDPTYKYDVGSDGYDTSEKRRAPAWCDRVLWQAPKGRVECLSYERTELTLSDHRPVGASLVLHVAVPNSEKRLQIESEILRSLDAWENSCVPTAELDTSDIDYGLLRYGVPYKRDLLCTNTGQTPLQFSFQPLPDSGVQGGFQQMPTWLDVSPWSGLLVPGEACTIRVRARVAGECAVELNERAKETGEVAKLESILLLRLLHGRDYYVTVRAEWQASCLGSRWAGFAYQHQRETEPMRVECKAATALGL